MIVAIAGRRQEHGVGIEISDLKQLDAYRWLVPRALKAGIRTDLLPPAAHGRREGLIPIAVL